MELLGIDHVQIAIPAQGEEVARSFYVGVLEMTELRKPPVLAARGGCWFRSGSVELHVGIDADFRPARKAHPALLVGDLEALEERLAQHGCRAWPGEELAGRKRSFTEDPFGNRIELIELLGVGDA
jgi:catechol 2,3-dioxygenase-like lactoylglutathione lyase family enzyme